MSDPSSAYFPFKSALASRLPGTGEYATRAEWVDALRGFALLGILLYNIEVLSGLAFSAFTPEIKPFGTALDPAIEFLGHWLIQGKFYSLFSFLFGMGIALQLLNAPTSGRRVSRRLTWLLIFGLLHAILLWFGDILTVYALLGFALLLAWRISTRALLISGVALLASPIPLYLMFMLLGVRDPLAGDPSVPPEKSFIFNAVRTMISGSYADVVQTNAWIYPGGWVRRASQLSLPRILGMFLLGAWAVRIGLPRLGESQETLLRAWLGCGVAFGLPLSLALAIAGGNQLMFPVSLHGLFIVVLSTISMPILCLGYVAAFGLYWRTAPHSLLVSAGRTSLSHYLAQSLVCVLLFYGYGLGLFGRIGYGPALLVSIGIFIALSAIARLWLRRFERGPVEMLWFRLSR
jgi:uncharacterized protein